MFPLNALARRAFTAAPGVVATLAFGSTAPASEKPARPNILWVVTEDNSPRYVGAYGDPLARTPNFDRLAREGVVFDRAYAAAPVCAPSRASLITGMYATSLGTQHMRSNVTLPDSLRYYPAFLRDAGYFTTNCAKTDYNAAILPGTWDESNAQAHWRHRKPGQPFFAVFNFAASHESRLHERRPLVTDPAKVHVPAYLPDTPEVRADIAQYYDCVAEADRQIGKIMAQLREDGLEEDTIIFYYSDHGGVIPRSKRFIYEEGTRIPLVIRFPEKFRSLAPDAPGSRSAELVSLVDFAPTLLSLVGVPIPGHFQGRAIAGDARRPAPEFVFNFRDRMDERYDLSRAVTDGRWRYIRNYRPDLPAGQRLDYLWKMASMAEWAKQWREGRLNDVQASFFRSRPVEELYDLAIDPENIRNLAGDPARRATLERLRRANREHVTATKDLGFMPEAMIHHAAGKNSPTIVADTAAYPLVRVVDLLDRLQLPASPPQADLADAAADAAAVVRYWAAVVARRDTQVPTFLAALLRDADTSVRIAAADSLLAHANNADAWTVLGAVLGDRAAFMEDKLEAANVVANHANWPESLQPVLQAAADADASAEPGVGALCRTILETRRAASVR